MDIEKGIEMYNPEELVTLILEKNQNYINENISNNIYNINIYNINIYNFNYIYNYFKINHILKSEYACSIC